MENPKNQKDTEKEGLNSYGHRSVSDIKSLVNKPVYEYVTKKTEKLVTALYMVTDHMEINDALKNKTRLLGVELLSDMYKLSVSSLVDNHVYVSSSLARIYEILSLIEISSTIGFISVANTSILKKEFNILISELQPSQAKDNPFAFTLDDKMFEVSQPKRPEIIQPNQLIKDKRTEYNMSFINKNTLSLTKKTNSNSDMSKEDRVTKILGIIKDKKNTMGNDVGISIKDISNTFKDYSEKTIQRELNSLVAKGQIKKIGAKRWSRYQAI